MDGIDWNVPRSKHGVTSNRTDPRRRRGKRDNRGGSAGTGRGCRHSWLRRCDGVLRLVLRSLSGTGRDDARGRARDPDRLRLDLPRLHRRRQQGRRSHLADNAPRHSQRLRPVREPTPHQAIPRRALPHRDGQPRNGRHPRHSREHRGRVLIERWHLQARHPRCGRPANRRLYVEGMRASHSLCI